MKIGSDQINSINEVCSHLQNISNDWLFKILDYWEHHVTDHEFGGFRGRIHDENKIDAYADKGAVLNARILWTFSAAFKITKKRNHLALAKRAMYYLNAHFKDVEYGGIYWTVDYKGQPKDTKKQIYAIAFWLYGLSEYYSVSHYEMILDQCRELYWLLEHYAFDKQNTGYFEAYTRDWKNLGDVRLSVKDANESKSMNTLLHVLEAYTNLYRIWPNKSLEESIRLLIQNFTDHIIDPVTFHLRLFFTDNWFPKHTQTISYGHDIEASWLLLEAAEVIKDEILIKKLRILSINMADVALEGVDKKNGGLWYELEGEILIKEKHWWPQAEALVGFINAWKISGDIKFLSTANDIIDFTDKYISNKIYGEWYWGVDEWGVPLKGYDKVGLWKCPYHNARACMEILRRMKNK